MNISPIRNYSNKKETISNYSNRSRKDNRFNSSGKMILKEYLENSKKERSSSVNSKDNSCSRISNISGINQYLDRRHNETKEKIEKLRMEKYLQETNNMKFTPSINKNSRKIIDTIINREQVISENKKVQPNQATFRKNNKTVKEKLKNTINEMEAYKKMIEKREIILRERENKEKSTVIRQNPIKYESRPLIDTKKRPNSANPRVRHREEIKDDSYRVYDYEKVNEARTRLNDMYNMERKRTPCVTNDRKENIDKIVNKYKKDEKVNENVLLSVDKNIDFHELDQFSPPNNIANIDFKMPNTDNINKYGNVIDHNKDYKNGHDKLERRGFSERHNNKEERNKIHRNHTPEPRDNRDDKVRIRDINNLKNFADNLNYDYTKENPRDFPRKVTSNRDDIDKFKLDNESKSFLMEKFVNKYPENTYSNKIKYI